LIMHAGADRTLEEAKRRWNDVADLPNGPAELVHTLADVVVDDYQTHSDRLEDEMENLEEIALQAPNAPIGKQLYGVKQQIARLRRYVNPAARLLDWALDPDPKDRPFTKEQAMLFRDVHDHLMRISDQIRNIDDLSQGIIDFTSTEHDKALNETTRKLTAWAAIFAVGTLIAGIYGMNFQLVPGDQTLFGFWFAIVLMVVSSVSLYFYFRNKKWL
jgi:magnesium transporter